VVATLRDNRINVVAKRTLGNTLNSIGAATAMVVSKTSTDKAILLTKSKSSIAGGSGAKTTTMHPKIPIGMTKFRYLRNCSVSFSIP
jgi:hypothetical protein